MLKRKKKKEDKPQENTESKMTIANFVEFVKTWKVVITAVITFSAGFTVGWKYVEHILQPKFMEKLYSLQEAFNKSNGKYEKTFTNYNTWMGAVESRSEWNIRRVSNLISFLNGTSISNKNIEVSIKSGLGELVDKIDKPNIPEIDTKLSIVKKKEEKEKFSIWPWTWF